MKRFTETRKWEDTWFCDLSAKWKLAWFYVLDHCDHAGFIDSNTRMMTFHIGEPINGDEFLRAMDGRVISVKPGKWLIPKFVQFQYGDTLNAKNNAHRGVIKRFEEIGVDPTFEIEPTQTQGANEPLTSPSLGAQDKDMDKEKDKDKEQDKAEGGVGETEFALEDATPKEKPKSARFVPPTPEEVAEYAKSINYPMDGQAWCDSYAQKGWTVGKNKMKDWKAAVRNWKSNNWQPVASIRTQPAIQQQIQPYKKTAFVVKPPVDNG